MGRRDELLSAIEVRLGRLAATGDLSAVLGQEALDDARGLAALLGDDDGDLHARYLLGIQYWHRSQGLPAGQGREDLAAAVTMLTPCFLAGSGALPPALMPALAEQAAPQAAVLFQQAVASPDLSALSGVAAIWERIRAAIPAGHQFFAASHAMAGTALQARFGLSGDATDLDAAIRAHETAIGTIPAGQPGRAMFACNLGAALRERFQLTGSRDDLDAAITLTEDAIRSAIATDPSRTTCQANLGLMLQDLFGQTGNLADLDAAVKTCRAAVSAALPGDPDLAGRMGNLGLALQVRFEASGNPADLDSAIDATRTAAGSMPPGHPHRSRFLSNLGSQLRDRFGLSGDPADLDAGIDAHRAAVNATPAGRPDRAAMLSNLGAALQARFERSGMLSDLDAAIIASREAADTAPDSLPGRPGILSNLGIGLRMRFERGGTLKDLDDAVAAGRAAADAAPSGHPDRGRVLTGLANALLVRYRRGRRPADLDDAVSAGRAAADLVPAGHPDRAGCLSNLASALGDRFADRDTPEDLDGAVAAAQAAADAAPDGHPARVNYLVNLGGALEARSRRGGGPSDADKALSAFAEAASIASAAPATRIQAARAAAALIAATDPGLASDLLETAITLLPQVTPRYLYRRDQQYAISGLAGLASDAAALALADTRDGQAGPQAAARALRLLEAGRALLLSQALDTRTELTDLRRQHPQLAQRFAELRDRLNQPPSASPGGCNPRPEVQAEERRRTAGQLEATLTEIRRLDGFAAFALPPAISELRAQACDGPVITFNVSQYRSDALLLTRDGVTSVRLPGLTRETVIDQITAFHQALRAAADSSAGPTSRQAAQTAIQDILGWLWDNAAGPALHTLGHDHAGDPAMLPRVWWAPGGLLSLLPVHAAGRYAQNPSATPRPACVMDLAVSSYTPTIRALRYARRQAASRQEPGGSLIVGMASTPGLPDASLPGVPAEISQLSRLLPEPVILVEPDSSSADTFADGSPDLPTQANVFRHLPGCSVAHFACHGESHPSDPSESMLLLHDHATSPLTVASLAPIQHDHLQLVYLSACSTTVSPAAEFLDEAIHLTSAFQLAGARHVIGTLWGISDFFAGKTAASIYQELRASTGTLRTDDTARALHHVIRTVRDKSPASPSQWAAYVHAGS